MATYKGVNKTLVDAGGVATIGRGLVDGRVKAMTDYYVILGSEASGSLLKVGGTLPTGANIVGFILKVSTSQTALTVSIGDKTTAARYLSAGTQLQTAGTYLVGGGDATGVPYVITGSDDNAIILTTGGATATAGYLTVSILYTQD